jgi:hypothetical protein
MPADVGLARSQAPPKPPAESDLLIIQSDAKPGSGARRKRPEVFSESAKLEDMPKPEPFKKVRVSAPFQVVYDATVYRPGDVATVPAALADAWIRDQWVTDDRD